RWKVVRTMILMGLLTGRRNEAVSAMKVHAKRKGNTGRRSLVTNVYTMGVKINAVASLERTMEMRVPRRNVFRNNRLELPPARFAACAASQSNNPAASTSADKAIMPR